MSTGVQLYFGQFLVEIYPGHSKLVSVLPSVDTVNDGRPNFLPDGGGTEERERRVGETSGPGAETFQGTDGSRFVQSAVVEHPSVDSVNDFRPNFPPDGGGSEERERRVGETSGLGAETFHGTDALERSVQYAVVQDLRQIVAVSPKYDRERIVAELNIENVLRRVLSDRLSAIARNVTFNLLRRLPETSSNLSSEDMKVFFVALCWSSMKKGNFLSSFSNMLEDVKSNPPDARISKLESQRPLLFDGKWIDKIDGEWINKIGAEHRLFNYKSVRSLLRFVRNRWNHVDEFQKTHKLESAESFCNYLDDLFPHLLRVSYGVAHQFCRRDLWFKEFL